MLPTWSFDLKWKLEHNQVQIGIYITGCTLYFYTIRADLVYVYIVVHFCLIMVLVELFLLVYPYFKNEHKL